MSSIWDVRLCPNQSVRTVLPSHSGNNHVKKHTPRSILQETALQKPKNMGVGRSKCPLFTDTWNHSFFVYLKGLSCLCSRILSQKGWKICLFMINRAVQKIIKSCNDPYSLTEENREARIISKLSILWQTMICEHASCGADSIILASSLLAHLHRLITILTI